MHLKEEQGGHVVPLEKQYAVTVGGAVPPLFTKEQYQYVYAKQRT